MILKKIIIKDQKELYRHKNYLLGLDLEFNSTKKEYSNSSEINFDNLFELTQFLKNHNFTYSIVEEKITDFKKQILAKYKTLQIDSNNYRDWETDRKSTRLNSSHSGESRMPSSA